MENIIDAREALAGAEENKPEEGQPEAPTPEVPGSEPAPAEKEQPYDKHIHITLERNGMVSVRSKGVCTVEFFGMMHEAKRLTTRNVEIQEAMAMEQAVRQQQELEAVRAAIAHPAPQPPRK